MLIETIDERFVDMYRRNFEQFSLSCFMRQFDVNLAIPGEGLGAAYQYIYT